MLININISIFFATKKRARKVTVLCSIFSYHSKLENTEILIKNKQNELIMKNAQKQLMEIEKIF
jgi:hypothetical protein